MPGDVGEALIVPETLQHLQYCTRTDREGERNGGREGGRVESEEERTRVVEVLHQVQQSVSAS